MRVVWHRYDISSMFSSWKNVTRKAIARLKAACERATIRKPRAENMFLRSRQYDKIRRAKVNDVHAYVVKDYRITRLRVPGGQLIFFFSVASITNEGMPYKSRTKNCKSKPSVKPRAGRTWSLEKICPPLISPNHMYLSL